MRMHRHCATKLTPIVLPQVDSDCWDPQQGLCPIWCMSYLQCARLSHTRSPISKVTLKLSSAPVRLSWARRVRLPEKQKHLLVSPFLQLISHGEACWACTNDGDLSVFREGRIRRPWSDNLVYGRACRPVQQLFS